MPLAPGARLGPYEIVAMLGSGGMGEVYQARDLRLGRNVAIKVLLSAVASDSRRLSRFEREAKALASLNHPNIAQLFELEDGPHGAFLVMELVDGPTLADRIVAGPVRLEDALAIAAQIADAVAAAHEQNVIHRDLKPANIKVRPDGVVKVLDFGLAKVVDRSDDGRNEPLPVTATSPASQGSQAMTSAGVILGTAAYMSPEQARGQAVDRRTDLWAFGCVLFEMLTGRRPFEGRTATDVLAAIIEREPDWRLIPASAPASVRRLIRRCLNKDPKGRVRDMADVRLDVEDALAAVKTEPRSAADTRRTTGWIRWPLGLMSAAAAAAVITWLIFFNVARSAVSDGFPTGATMEQLTYDSGVTQMPALSPDGRLLAYASDRAGNGDLDIWIQQMSGGTPLRLTDDPADDSTPDFSPDGSQLAFRSERNGGGIYVVPALGGSARLIAAEGRQPRFSPDGSRLAFWTGQFRGENLAGHHSSVFVIALSGGSISRLLPEFDVAANPLWTSDGRSLIVAGHPKGQPSLREGFDWWMVPIDGGPPVKTGVFDTAVLRAAPAIAPGAWLSGGLVFSFGDDLWRVMLSSGGRSGGPPERLTLGVGPYIDPTTNPNGEIVFARLVTQRAIERASLANTTEVPVRLYSDSSSTPWRASSTPDGEKIVLERDVGSARELWIKNTVSGRQDMVVRVPTRDSINATISADGARIAYTRDSTAFANQSGAGFVVEASGGVPRQVCDACAIYGFLADNTRVLAAVADGHAIRGIDSRTAVARDLVVARDGRLDRPHASPDDRLLAFRRSTGSIGKSYVIRFPMDQPAHAESAPAIDEPTVTGRPTGWSLDSRAVYLLLDADGFRCVWEQRVDPATAALVGKPVAVRHFHSINRMSTSFGNAATQRGFLFEAADATSNLWKFRPALRR